MKTKLNAQMPEIFDVCEISVVYRTKRPKGEKITSSRDLEAYLRPWYEKTGMMEQKEIFTAVYLDNANQPICLMKISEGSSTATVVDLPYILRAAILANCKKIAVCHNHPTGVLKPSEPDKAMVKNIQAALKPLDITLLDSLIIGCNGCLSMADEGLM
jgi:DNA repair protein RadC